MARIEEQGARAGESPAGISARSTSLDGTPPLRPCPLPPVPDRSRSLDKGSSPGDGSDNSGASGDRASNKRRRTFAEKAEALRAVESGMTRAQVCNQHGIDQSTMALWRQKEMRQKILQLAKEGRLKIYKGRGVRKSQPQQGRAPDKPAARPSTRMMTPLPP
eukprot:jgi/Mesvir1/22429/Mv17904-RA.1